MASTDYNFLSTRDGIIKRALRKIGVVNADGTPSANQYTQGSEALNEIVKALQSEDIFIWTLATKEIALTKDTTNYAVSDDPPPVAIESVQLEYPADTYQELELISMRDYLQIEDKARTAPAQVVAFDGKEVPKVYIYPVAEANSLYSIHVTYVAKLKDWDDSSATGDLPVRFQRALTYLLAADLGDEYGVPLQERDAYEKKGMSLLGRAMSSARDRRDITVTKGAY